MSVPWSDEGPAGPGKILAAVLQGDDGKAGVLLRRWSPADLRALDRAAMHLQTLISIEDHRRGGLS